VAPQRAPSSPTPWSLLHRQLSKRLRKMIKSKTF
jgi:hypothetical protein